MYNATKIFIIALLATLGAASCSSSDKRAEEAAQLISEAQVRISSGQYPEAFTLLDTLDKKYRDCLTERREGTLIRTRALLTLTQDSIAANDERRAALTREVDRLAPDFRQVTIPGTEGFRVYKSVYTGRETDVTGIQARIDENDYMFLAVSVKGKVLHITGLTVADSTSTGVASVPVEGSEIATLRQEQAAPVIGAMMSAQAPLTVKINGLKGSANVKLDAKQLAAIKATWQYALALQQHRAALINREKLERQLIKLRENLSNLEAAAAENTTGED